MSLNKRLLLAFLTFSFIATIPYGIAEEKELVFIFQKQKNPALIREEARKVGESLEKELGLKVQTQVPGSYAASVQALISGKADAAYLDSIAFLLAQKESGAKIILAEQRTNAEGKTRTDYDSIFVVRKDSPLQSFEDLKKNAKNLRMIFTSPTSTSGYVMPYRRFVKEGMLKAGEDPKKIFEETGFGGGYTQALEQVIAKRGDVCAVSYYTMEGDSSNKYLPEESRAQLRILARTPGVPTHVIAVRSGLSEEVESNFKKALLSMSKNSPKLLSDVYGTSQFVEVEEAQHVKASEEALTYLKLPAEKIVYK